MAFDNEGHAVIESLKISKLIWPIKNVLYILANRSILIYVSGGGNFVHWIENVIYFRHEKITQKLLLQKNVYFTFHIIHVMIGQTIIAELYR